MIPSEKLFAYGKFITETELQKITKEGDYLLFHSGIEEMIESGLLSPVKAIGGQWKQYHLFSINTVSSSHGRTTLSTWRAYGGSIHV